MPTTATTLVYRVYQRHGSHDATIADIFYTNLTYKSLMH